MLQCRKKSAREWEMRFPSQITTCVSILLLLGSTACSSKASDHQVWDHYSDHQDAVSDQDYIDNDEYYVAPTGGYVYGASSGILDAD